MHSFRLTTASLALVLSGIMYASTPAQAEQLMFISEIPGDATQEGYENWIRLHSVSTDIANGHCSSFQIAKPRDSASLGLILAASTGKMFNTITIVDIQPTDLRLPVPTVTIQLTPAKISNISLSGSSGSELTESLAIDAEDMVFNPGPDEYRVSCTKRLR